MSRKKALRTTTLSQPRTTKHFHINCYSDAAINEGGGEAREEQSSCSPWFLPFVELTVDYTALNGE